ncbi:unnamed protein product, partial [Prorocentrum cordatum]
MGIDPAPWMPRARTQGVMTEPRSGLGQCTTPAPSARGQAREGDEKEGGEGGVGGKKQEGGRSRDELRQARTLRDGAAVKTGGAKSSNRAELRGENPEQRGEGGMQRPTCTGPQTARKQRTSTRTRTGTRQGKGN